MPADYLAVRDSCYKSTKEKSGTLTEDQKQECKKKASIWYFKKHGKPVEHDSKGEFIFIVNKNNDENFKSNLNVIFSENCIDKIEEKDDNLFITIVLSESKTLSFTQPFSKEDSHYFKYEDRKDIQNGPTQENDLNTEDNSLSQDIKYCNSCIHFVRNGLGAMIGQGDSEYETNFCHLVKGFIDDLGVCNYYKDSFIEFNNVNAKSTNKRKIKKCNVSGNNE